jgi:hypothetical protein
VTLTPSVTCPGILDFIYASSPSYLWPPITIYAFIYVCGFSNHIKYFIFLLFVNIVQINNV